MKRIVTLKQASRLTGLNVDTLRAALKSRTLKGSRGRAQNSHWRISVVELSRWWRDDMHGGELFEEGEL